MYRGTARIRTCRGPTNETAGTRAFQFTVDFNDSTVQFGAEQMTVGHRHTLQACHALNKGTVSGRVITPQYGIRNGQILNRQLLTACLLLCAACQKRSGQADNAMGITVDHNAVTAACGSQQHRCPFVRKHNIIEQIDGNRTLIALVGQILHCLSQANLVGNIKCSISVSKGHGTVLVDNRSGTNRTQGKSAVFQRNTVRIVLVNNGNRHLARIFQQNLRCAILNGYTASVNGTDDRTDALISVTDLGRGKVCSGNRTIHDQMIGILVCTGMADYTTHRTVGNECRSAYRAIGYGNHRIFRHVFLTLCGRRISD